MPNATNADPASHLAPIDVGDWVIDFSIALSTKDTRLLRELFTPDATWRDNLALTWSFKQQWGIDALAASLLRSIHDVDFSSLQLSSDWHSPGEVIAGGQPLIEFMLDFDTQEGRNLAVVWAERDVRSPHGFRAFNLYTRLNTLKRFEATPPVDDWEVHPRRERNSPPACAHRHHKPSEADPEVVIVGGGHGGAFVAAHLDRLGVENLILERNERIGDNWRKRYQTLRLHNPTQANHFPFLPYPVGFPDYVPKDLMAEWIETYASVLELRYWLGTEFCRATYDLSRRVWSVHAKEASGSERVLHPRHLVLATGGIGGLPYMPSLPGLETYAGKVVHSSLFDNSAQWAGKRILIVGVGASAHDIAQDLYEHNAKVTMLQRGPVTVTNIGTANLLYADYLSGYDPDLLDLRLAAGYSAPLIRKNLQAYTQLANELDADLHARLRTAGMELDDGEDGTGWGGKFVQRGGGFYLNVGASDIIAAGGIEVRQYRDMERFTPGGLVFRDQSSAEFDAVVMCTGYHNRAAELTRWFDSDIASRFVQIGMVGASGEAEHTWIPTEQEGLWFMMGGFQPARIYAGLLARGIKADLEGLLPYYARMADGSPFDCHM